tara:strand:- start:755 stop:1237 length:483 start_codon:yes stop_codon:yes gene_type:complete
MTLDELLGRGGATTFFVNYDEAREFVQSSINDNQRLTEDEKRLLLILEEEAVEHVFTETAFGKACRKKDIDYPGKVDLTIQPTAGGGVRTCLQNYYYYLQDQFPLVTTDQRFLAIFDAAADGVTDVNTSVSKVEDLFKPNRNAYAIGIGALLIAFLILRR